MELLGRIRRATGASQQWLAERAGTSRTTLSAYEHGAKSPTVETAGRILAVLGYEVTAAPIVTFASIPVGNRTVPVPDRLPRLDLDRAFATVSLPLHLNWSNPDRIYHLDQRRDRALVYETVLIEGTAEDVLGYVDGALLIDLWPTLVIPSEVRTAWAPLVENGLRQAA
ncbi:helix-turn-helix domain-containing protein [Sciscionella marina]|uniref:helix-turn-helix domain-containing protein n=1 Tax=Sciscionella marina TaxID=508770 RepID=UPI000365DC9F|nr:helix-turn-helix domain-containing protein [Sciscionella marina]